MLRDITIGQHFPGNSLVHRFDPRLKLVLTIVYIVLLFAASNPLGLTLSILFLAAMYTVAKIPLKMIGKSLKPILPIVIFTAVLNLFFVSGEGEPLVHIWFLTIYAEGVRYAVLMAVRVMALIAGTSLLTYTTSPIVLTDAIEQLLKPLGKLHFPVHELAMMMSIALRFIPTLIEETDKIMSAQKARGADFESGNLINQEELLSDIINERSYYLKQKYSDDQKLSRLYDDEKTQLQRIETWTKPFVAADPGIISFYTDGYERVLSSQTYDTFTPAEVRSMYRGNLPKSAALGRNEVAVYRLVRQGGYTVLMLCDDVNWTPTVGASYELLVESFDNTRVSATVESVTRSEGELLVRLSVVGDVSPVLYIRSCHVQLSESIYSLTVPANAITTVDGEMGVVVVQPDGNYFLPVTIISQDSNEAHIVPQLSNILSVGSVVLVF